MSPVSIYTVNPAFHKEYMEADPMAGDNIPQIGEHQHLNPTLR